MIWSHDGKRLFAGGGFDDRIYRFDRADGLLSNKTVLAIPPARDAGSRRVPAGLALSKTARRSTWPVHSATRWPGSTPRTGAFRDEIALEAGSYPYGLALDEAHKRLYVSLWSKARVAVVDIEEFRGGRSVGG